MGLVRVTELGPRFAPAPNLLGLREEVGQRDDTVPGSWRGNFPRALLSNPAVRRSAPFLLALLACACGSGARAEQPAPKPRQAQPRPAIDPRIGNLAEFDPAVRRAFEGGPEDFDPVPTPGPHDWLAQHDEESQTVGSFWLSNPNRPSADGRDTLYIVPLGEVPSLAGLTEYAHDFYTLKVERLPAVDLDALEVTRRTHHGHEQILAKDFQNYLQANLPGDAYAMLGLTMVDLYPGEGWNFVYGYASLEDRTGVFSLARYDPRFFDADATPRPGLVRERVFKVMTHEIGHMFGMRHCVHFHCLMNGVNHEGELDAAPPHLCPVCLRKLHMLTDFDPATRYDALKAHYARADWDEAKQFIDRRLGRIRKP